MKNFLDFYKGKKVLVTGHTGFKGSWLCEVLLFAGADICGYALEPPTEPSLFKINNIESRIRSVIGDVRDFDKLKTLFDEFKPEIVIHMAAQPLVRESYKEPRYTFDVNVMGTVNVLECIRQCNSVKSFVNVTTDKVYLNEDLDKAFKEEDYLCGYDPYSNSKSCSELVTYSYRNSFFKDRDIAISTCRAGNVIGGGDFATDRIVPDCFRAASERKAMNLRNPNSIRPYQHVLEPVFVYLYIAYEQYYEKDMEGSYNVGPDVSDCITTGEISEFFKKEWNSRNESEFVYEHLGDNGPHEAGFLKLNCDKLKTVFAWKPVLNIKEAISLTAAWYTSYINEEDIFSVMTKQIEDYYTKWRL